MRTTLYCSPHLDDVALSCAGGVLARLQSGRRVIVASVFTQGSNARARRREDAAALCTRGAEVLHLDLLDAPERLRVRPSFASLVLSPEVDQKLVEQIKRDLGAVIASEEPDQIFFPLGVGGHIDHRTLFAAWPVAGRRARFYEDRPYALVPALRALRLLELRGGRLRNPPGVGALDLQLRAAPMVAGLIGARERRACLAGLAARLALTHRGLGLSLRSRLSRWPLESLAAATSLIGSYRSQHALIDQVAAGYRRGAVHPAGGWFEREWRSVPGKASPGSGRAARLGRR